MKPLDGARLKVVRAQEHLDAFKAEARGFLDSKPYIFESEIYPDYWWLKPRPTAHPDRWLSIIVGDVVTNIRAALDYAIWELASRYFKPQIDLAKQADRHILNFPILLADPLRRQGYIDHLHRLEKRGIPAPALQIIKSAQADVSGDESLRWLYDLVNTDKHRTPILTVSVVDRVQVGIDSFNGVAILLRSDEYPFLNHGLTLKAPSALLDGIKDGTVKVDLQLALAITSGNIPMPRLPLDQALTQIVKCVSDVIPRFEPFLS